jgi:hypothetical protein
VVTQIEVKDDKTQDSIATTVAGAAYNKSNTKKGKKNKAKN